MTMILGDCLVEMKKMADNSIDFVVTDSPFGISFMSKHWDQQIPPIEYWKEILRVCKPGAMMAAAGLPRMYHRLACVIEDAGWQIRDCILHLFGSGFPKSLNHLGFKGYGTALKPAYEPWILVMKPLEGTFAQNAQKWGVAGINIDSSRIFPVTSQRLSDIISEKGESEWELEKYLCNSCVNLVENKTKQEIQEIMESFVTKNVELITIEKVKKHLIDTNILDIGCLNILFQEGQKKVQNASLFLNMLKYGKKQTVKSLKDMLFTILTMILGTTDSKICSLCLDPNISVITKKVCSENLIQLKNEELNTIGEQEKDIIKIKKNDVNNCEKNTQNARWPSNLILSEESAQQLDQMTGISKSPMGRCSSKKKNPLFQESKGLHTPGRCHEWEGYSDSGGASRFFYTAKSSSKERNAGLEGLPLKECQTGCEGAMPIDDKKKERDRFKKQAFNHHPTVKPLSLMRYMLKLLAPPGNPICLDPFAGSGSTVCAAVQLGINCIGIEKEPEYFEIAQKRIEFYKNQKDVI